MNTKLLQQGFMLTVRSLWPLLRRRQIFPDGEMSASLSTLLLNKLGILRSTSVSHFNTHIKLSNLKKQEADRRLNLVKKKRKRLDVIMNEILISKHQIKKDKAQMVKIVKEIGKRKAITERFVNAVNVIMEHVDNCDETSSEEEEDVSESEENDENDENDENEDA
ncbi:hypothetical protein WICPIJ_001915 [Wickerhamomyces pijperi]|uniref:Uncharacterized protein n=1 Tax=Wickerhamomyces pijperi TaxID=599730 RepID=A0A9P8QCL8_WICPI|nr:hypothetical protein WICPIJ_001915 [Wickerhamomyces pijperi]